MKLFKRQSSKKRLFIVFSLILVIGGLIGVVPTLYYKWTGNGTAPLRSGPIVYAQGKAPAGVQNSVGNKTPTSTQPIKTDGMPISISITPVPYLPTTIQVVPGYYNPKTQSWNLSLTQAQFATPSVEPNSVAGNTIIYGHYRPEVFAYLHLIKPGAKAYVTTDQGYLFTYTYEDTYALDPSNTSIFSYQGPPILTVQTCSGAYFQNRQMYQFGFDSVQKIQ